MSKNKTALEIQKFCEDMAEMMEERGDKPRAEAFWIVRNMIQTEYVEDWTFDEGTEWQ